MSNLNLQIQPIKCIELLTNFVTRTEQEQFGRLAVHTLVYIVTTYHPTEKIGHFQPQATSVKCSF